VVGDDHHRPAAHVPDRPARPAAKAVGVKSAAPTAAAILATTSNARVGTATAARSAATNKESPRPVEPTNVLGTRPATGLREVARSSPSPSGCS
jgi:hypothetical protein